MIKRSRNIIVFSFYFSSKKPNFIISTMNLYIRYKKKENAENCLLFVIHSSYYVFFFVRIAHSHRCDCAYGVHIEGYALTAGVFTMIHICFFCAVWEDENNLCIKCLPKKSIFVLFNRYLENDSMGFISKNTKTRYRQFSRICWFNCWIFFSIGFINCYCCNG
jgi:hypothetical protein